MQKGDTLSAIASRHGVTVQALFAANRLGWASIIYPGQKLTLPGGQAATVQTPAPAPAPAPQAPVAASGVYTVQKGDTLSSIAQRNGVTRADAVRRERPEFGVDHLPRAEDRAQGATCCRSQRRRRPPRRSPSRPSTPSSAANAQLIIRIGRAARRARSRARDRARRGDAGVVAAQPRRPAIVTRSVSSSSAPARAGAPPPKWATPNGRRGRSSAARPTPTAGARAGLLDIPGWQSLSFTEAAQAVQISAHPELYGPWEPAALAWLASLG